MPRRLSRLLAERGHEVRLVVNELAEGATDRVVADYADEIEATVVTFNVRDYEPLIDRSPGSVKRAHPHYDPSKRRRLAGALFISCSRAIAVTRLEANMGLIEWEFARAAGKSDTRVIMELAAHRVVVKR